MHGPTNIKSPRLYLSHSPIGRNSCSFWLLNKWLWCSTLLTHLNWTFQICSCFQGWNCSYECIVSRMHQQSLTVLHSVPERSSSGRNSGQVAETWKGTTTNNKGKCTFHLWSPLNLFGSKNILNCCLYFLQLYISQCQQLMIIWWESASCQSLKAVETALLEGAADTRWDSIDYVYTPTCQCIVPGLLGDN